MKQRSILTVFLLIFWSSTAAADQYYSVPRCNIDDYYLKKFDANIVLKGHPDQIMKFRRWLDQISLVPKGFQTLWTIADSGHELIIEHADLPATLLDARAGR
jgi:hypothetical protein